MCYYVLLCVNWTKISFFPISINEEQSKAKVKEYE